MSLKDQAKVSRQPGKTWGGWVGLAIMLLVLLVLGVRLLARAAYPADVEKNAEAYENLVRLTLARSGGDDYVADVGDVGGEMETLMRRLGLDRVQCYPGNDQHPGSWMTPAQMTGSPHHCRYQACSTRKTGLPISRAMTAVSGRSKCRDPAYQSRQMAHPPWYTL